jgi:hypothetical protein
MSQVLIGFIALVAVMLAVPLLMAWVNGRRKLRVGRVGGALVLRMPRGHYAILAAVAVLPFAAFTILALAVAWKPESGSSRYVLAGFTGLLGFLAGAYLLSLEVRGCIRIDDRGLTRVGAWGSVRTTWEEVAKITFNPVSNWFFLTLSTGERLYVVEGLHGIADFAELALQRLPKPVLAAAPDAVEALTELAES